MGKLIAVVPTWVLLALLGWGWYLGRIGEATASLNWLAGSMVGLGVYPVVTVFVAGIAKTVTGSKQYSRSERWFYSYLIGLEVIVVLGAIYWMAHN